MSVYVERLDGAQHGLVVGRLTADCRGELLVFAGRLGLGVPRLQRRGAPDEHVPLTAAGWQDAVARGALEIVWLDGVEHVRTPVGDLPVPADAPDLAS